jgi:hypothetical protein
LEREFASGDSDDLHQWPINVRALVMNAYAAVENFVLVKDPLSLDLRCVLSNDARIGSPMTRYNLRHSCIRGER